ncbi:hypothetical protein MSAN_00139500 [Mycena sanguinolenta]|uniref:Uncharacterized protein n=1 Tax=Mycena sanguinolenta TaxID=230812 RepID=A0A8H6ZDY2_9AGAR|nr:hypothetical protein MSAN_00139500 [Mycena sanguinolenta]
MFFFFPGRLACIGVLFFAGSATAFPIIHINSVNSSLSYPGDGPRSLSLWNWLAARAIDKGDVKEIAHTFVAPIAGSTAVAIFLIIFVCCFRIRKSPKKEDMGTNNPLPVAERPPWAA